MREQETGKVVRAAGLISAITLLSRVTGFLRDAVIAALFGATPAADAFFVAFRIPNLLRRLFAEGALTIAFIPVFTETMLQKGMDSACELARSLTSILSLTLLFVCALGMVFAPEVVSVIAYGFEAGQPSYELAVTLTRWCFPYIFFISLAALASGVLNSCEHFFSPAFSPVLLNISIIAAALGLNLDPPVLNLAVGVLAGGAAQFLVQLPFVKNKGMSMLPSFRFRNPALKRIFWLMLPAAFGAAVYQISVMINTVLASLLDSGSISYLYYADRLVEFPLGIFAVAIGTAVLPSLSRQAATGDLAAMVQTFGHGIRLTMFICLPAMAGLLLLAELIVDAAFGRGNFNAADIAATTKALWGYGLGLWAFAGLRVVLPAFYAVKDTRTPLLVGIAALLVNVGASLTLMTVLGHMGLALSTSISSAVNLLILLWLLRCKLGRLGLLKILRSLLGIGGACLFMAAGLWLLKWGLESFWRSNGWELIAGLLFLIVLGMALYILAAKFLRLDEINELQMILRRKLKKGSSLHYNG